MKLERIDYKDGKVEYIFFCPGCKINHSYCVKGNGVPIWNFNGDVDKPTFTPSLRVRHGNDQLCHLFMTEGKIRFLNDCTHYLSGKIVDMFDL